MRPRKAIVGTPRIFVSYRRTDSLLWVELLHQELQEQFGADNVFVDIEGIDLGEDFASVIEQRVRSCDVLLAVIGPDWLSATDKDGRRRIDQPDDYVRHEIAVALSRNIEVIPVFVAGARPPKRIDLPPDIADLAELNGYVVGGDLPFRQAVDQLIARLEGLPEFRKGYNRFIYDLRLRRVAFQVVPASVLVVFFAFWVGLFDKLALDTQIETYTIWLGDWFKEVRVSDEVVIVAITEDTEIRLKKPFDRSWRAHHAQLIEALSRSGAKAILFDMALREPAPRFDEKLITAVEFARSNGTAVFFPTDGEPSSIPGLEQEVTGLGHSCIGRKLGYARTLPLVVVKGEDRVLLPSLALLGAYPDGLVELVDDPDNRGKGSCAPLRGIQVRTAQGIQPIDYYHYGQVSGAQHACPAIYEGDCAAEVIIVFRPLAVLRDPARYYRYEDIVENASTFHDPHLKGKIVVVGRVTERDWIEVLYKFEKARREGLELHAEAITTLLQGETPRPLGTWNQFLIMLAMGVLGAWARYYRRLASPGRRRVYCAVVVGIYLGACILLYVDFGLLLNVAYHIGAFFMAYWTMGTAARRMGIWENNKISTSRRHTFSGP